MGGHHEPFKVPDPSKYTNWQKIPELVQYNKKLAQLGLTDPFIRNYFHKFDPDSGAYAGPVRRSKMLTYMNVLRPGFITGFISAALLIAIEETYTYYNYGSKEMSNYDKISYFKAIPAGLRRSTRFKIGG